MESDEKAQSPQYLSDTEDHDKPLNDTSLNKSGIVILKVTKEQDYFKQQEEDKLKQKLNHEKQEKQSKDEAPISPQTENKFIQILSKSPDRQIHSETKQVSNSIEFKTPQCQSQSTENFSQIDKLKAQFDEMMKIQELQTIQELYAQISKSQQEMEKLKATNKVKKLESQKQKLKLLTKILSLHKQIQNLQKEDQSKKLRMLDEKKNMLMLECNLQDLNNIDSQIKECQQALEMLKQSPDDDSFFKQMETRLEKLNQIKSILEQQKIPDHQEKQQEKPSELQLLKLQLRKGLEQLKCEDYQLQKRMEACTKMKNMKIKMKKEKEAQIQAKKQQNIKNLLELRQKIRGMEPSSFDSPQGQNNEEVKKQATQIKSQKKIQDQEPQSPDIILLKLKQKLLSKLVQQKIDQKQLNNRISQLQKLLLRSQKSKLSKQVQIQKKKIEELKQIQLLTYKIKQLEGLKMQVKKNFVIFKDGLILCKTQYTLDNIISDILNQNKIQINQKLFLTILNPKDKSQIECDIKEKFETYIKESCDIQGKVQILFQVQYEKEKKYFKKNTQVDSIMKKFKIRGKNYYFFTQFYQEYTEEQLHSDLIIYECDVCNVKFLEKITKNVIIPSKLSLSKAINFIQAEAPETKYIGKIKIQDKIMEIEKNCQKSLAELTLGKLIQEIEINYKIQLKIEIVSLKNSRQVLFQAKSSQTILNLKTQFENTCNLKAKYQKWIYNQNQFSNQVSFQDLGIIQDKCRIQVYQILNLQYYGFSKQDQIDVARFRQFYIEDDQAFVKQINESNFPQSSYEFAFRTKALGIIFAAVKKHCRIQSALNSIKTLVSSSQKHRNLWMPKNAKQTTFFNENYALINILNSGDDDLRIDFMRIYKNHSPLPIISKTLSGQHNSFKNHHYWICSKSLSIVSLQLFTPVKGKSTFLNKIFNSDFQYSGSRHPICSRSMFIKYNIYRNQDKLVDIIDVSSQSIQNDQKIEICQAANILIIHYHKNQYEDVRKWIQTYCKQKAVVLIERQSNLIQNHDSFQTQLHKNKISQKIKQYYIPQMNESNLRYYSYSFASVSDQINEFVVELSNKYESSNEKWKLTEYFSQKQKILGQYTEKLRKLENQFSEIIDIETLLNSKSKVQEFKISKTMLGLLDIRQEKFIDRFFSKLRQFARIYRYKKMKKFSGIGQIQKIVEVKSQKNIGENFQALKKHFQSLQEIPKNQINPKFESAIKKFKQMSLPNVDSNKLIEIVTTLSQSFNFQIKLKQFSIQNLWRILAKFFGKSNAISTFNSQIRDKAQQIYARQFLSGRSFEIINGDTLDMPINLLKSNLGAFQNKKIMVIGIFGPQSSGKSTLLNFLFGCDFLSSDGRCTNGVYGTYYQVSGQNIYNCQGFLILDTEGLFSNYKRKCSQGQNFDNKLVLFLLKVCDILILNTRGDVDNNCQNILQLSFDSELMEHKQGIRYPNFYIVLNQSSGLMNQQQKSEIRQLRTKILSVSPQMEKFISSNQSNSMPIAFNTGLQQGCSKYLKSIQTKNKTPTEEFYNDTKQLANRLTKILTNRGKLNQPRTLNSIYDQMHATWSTILNLPMLTKYTSRMMKKFQQEVTNWKYDLNFDMETLMNKWKNNMPIDLYMLVQWEKKKQKQFQDYVSGKIDDFTKKFPQGTDMQRNTMISLAIMEIKPKMYTYMNSLKLQVASKKYKCEVEQSQKRGIDSISRVARQLRRKNYIQNISLKEQEIQKEFLKAWREFSQNIRQKIDRQKASEDLYNKIHQFYDNQLKCSGQRDRLPPTKLNINYKQTLDQYSKNIGNLLLKNYQNSYIFQDLQITPIISTTRSGPSQLTYKYLDMRNFFQFQTTNFYYYIKSYRIPSFINIKSLQTMANEQLKRLGMVTKFISQIKQDLAYFKSYVNEEQLRKILIQSFFDIYYGRQGDYFINSTFVSITKPDTKIILKDVQEKFPKGKFNLFKNNDIFQIIQSEKRWYNYSQSHIMKIILSHYIKLFIQLNYNSFQLQRKEIKKNLQQKVKQTLKVVGINLKLLRIQGYDVNFEVSNQNPINVKSLPSLYQMITQLPDYIDRKALSNAVSQDDSRQNLKIAYSNEDQIRIKKNFQSQEILKLYMNKQYSELLVGVKNPKFKKFVHQHINSNFIITQLVKQIKKLPDNSNIENAVKKIMIFLRKQISDFNIDLKQISQQLSFNFVVDLHDLSVHLLWKFFEEVQWNKNQKILSDLKAQERNQRDIFMGILLKDPKVNCQTNAVIVANQYKKFLVKENQNEKSVYVQNYKKKFLDKHTRAQLQKTIDKQMGLCNNVDKVFQYLTNPATIIFQYYEQFVQEAINQIDKEFKTETIGWLNEMIQLMSQIQSVTQGLENKWDSEQLFQKVFDCGVKVKQIFVELLSFGKAISCEYLKNKFQLKKGVQFNIKNKISRAGNLKFLKQLLALQFQIPNYAMFIKHLLLKIKQIKSQIQKSSKFGQQQKKLFKTQVQLNICKFECPCCGRLCDIDMKKQEHHKIHKCQSGHQMRAVKGIRIEKKKGSNQYYASVLRCEDILDLSVFQFNDKQYKWKQFKEEKKNQWDFKGQNISVQNARFKNMWQVAGKKICLHRQKLDGMPMTYLDYSDGTIQFVQKIQPEQCQYVFSIDGSGSMSGTKWKQQLTSLKTILSQLANSQNNKVSINVFTDDDNIIYKNRSPHDIDVNTIQFPSGATVYEAVAAFRGGIKVIKDFVGKMNVYFIYISDGHGVHPTAQIQEMLNLKKQTISKGFKFDYASILIGGDSRAGMDLINQDMKGESKWVSNAGQISNTFRQILLTKK